MMKTSLGWGRALGVLLVALTAFGARAAADQFPRQPGIKILRYSFDVSLGDASDSLTVKDFIDLQIQPQGANELTLNLCKLITAPAAPDRENPCLKIAPRAPRGSAAPVPPAPSSVGTGMTVTSVRNVTGGGGEKLNYTHENDRLKIELPAGAKPGDELRIEVDYHGVPAIGLNIGVTRYGDRAFYTDNWPNKARNWLATIDHISVKTPKTITVTAPVKYHVISNGLMTEDSDLGNGLRRTTWVESEPIPSWQFSLGVGQMAVEHFGSVGNVALSAWVFPENRDAGFKAIDTDTKNIFDFYSSHIGPYAYEKLAQVEAAFGGGATEPATTIFYYGGFGASAHEMAHHWFGDAVTEADWDDVWLSEGFATYFNLLYTEHKDGHDAFIAGVKRTRDTALAYETAHPNDTIVHNNLAHGSDVFENSSQIYQGGAMVLHMLRGVLGTDDFWAGIRLYYSRYFNQQATSDDFRKAMQDACILANDCPEENRDLTWFFHEWLNRGGYMTLNGGWHYDPAAKQLQITLDQAQTQGLFRMPIEIGLTLPPGVTLPAALMPAAPAGRGGRGAAGAAAGRGRGSAAAPQTVIVKMLVDRQHNTLTIPLSAAPTAVELDPNTWVPMMKAAFTAK